MHTATLAIWAATLASLVAAAAVPVNADAANVEIAAGQTCKWGGCPKGQVCIMNCTGGPCTGTCVPGS